MTTRGSGSGLANMVKKPDKLPAEIAAPERRGTRVTNRPRPETAEGTASEGKPPLGEDELLRGLADGESAAFEQLVRTHGPRMLSVARRILRSEDDARDCLQEAFIRAFSAINQFEGRASLGTWLHRITVNAALMKLRSRKSVPEQSIEDLMPNFDSDGCRIEPMWQFDESVETMIGRREVRDLVLASIGKLPDSYRTVLLLRDIEEHTTEEVASELGISAGAVKIRLHRARAALKKLLEPVFERGEKP